LRRPDRALSHPPQWRTYKKFSGADRGISHALRAEFETAFRDPFRSDRKRFCWDLWHVKDQYHFLRTPAWEFFSPPLYRSLHRKLLAFGQEQLGCHNITPPWLSLYIDGCEQKLHGDVPHGPWAFVLSLSRRTSARRGGETVIWTGGTGRSASAHFSDLSLSFAPTFDQLLVFSPDTPHGVSRVTGVQDPLEGRLVIHGWFTTPSPFVRGGLEGKKSATARALSNWVEAAPHPDRFQNLVVELSVSANGRLQNTRVIQGPNGYRYPSLPVVFPKAPRASRITVPLAFT
jgi:hypothetical protein